MGETEKGTGSIRPQDSAYAYYDESLENVSLGMHHHTQNEMVFVREGRCLFEISGKPYCIEKNQILLISALENHLTRVLDVPYRRYVFVSSMDLCSEYIHDPILASAFICSRMHHGAVSLPADMAGVIERHLETLVNETANREQKWEERCAGIQFDILVLLYRAHPQLFLQEKDQKDINVIFSIKDYVDHHYNEDLNLDNMASKFFISKYYLSHQFKNLIGYGFKNYIQLLRINKAKILLQSTDFSLNDISSRVGYDNINYFIRIFKEKEEMTPHQYRKMSDSGKHPHA